MVLEFPLIKYDINFAEGWALRVERVRTGSEMRHLDGRHLLDESSIFPWFLDGYLKKITWMWKKKHHKSRSCSLGFLKFHGDFPWVFPHLALKDHHIFQSVPMCVTYKWASNVSPVSRKISWPQPTCALCSVEPESPARGWIDAATKCWISL